MASPTPSGVSIGSGTSTVVVHATNGEATGPRQNELDKLPLLEDVMQLARLGDIEAMKRLFESGKFEAGYKDHEGITPLHVCLPFRRCGID